jgi:hypothetical protein
VPANVCEQGVGRCIALVRLFAQRGEHDRVHVNDNVPENMRASLKTSFEQSRKAWKAAAANPQAKATLGSTCKQAMETARQAMASYKCDF